MEPPHPRVLGANRHVQPAKITPRYKPTRLGPQAGGRGVDGADRSSGALGAKRHVRRQKSPRGRNRSALDRRSVGAGGRWSPPQPRCMGSHQTSATSLQPEKITPRVSRAARYVVVFPRHRSPTRADPNSPLTRGCAGWPGLTLCEPHADHLVVVIVAGPARLGA